MSEILHLKQKSYLLRTTQIIQEKKEEVWSSDLSTMSSFNDGSLPSSGKLRPVDPRKRSEKMARRDLFGTNQLDRSTSRKRAHLKSDFNYNWEIAMRSGSTTPEWRQKRKQKPQSSSSFFKISISGRLKKEKLPLKKKPKHSDFTIPTIIITESSPDITERNERDREGSQKLERTTIPDVSTGLDIVAKFDEFKIRV